MRVAPINHHWWYDRWLSIYNWNRRYLSVGHTISGGGYVTSELTRLMELQFRCAELFLEKELELVEKTEYSDQRLLLQYFMIDCHLPCYYEDVSKGFEHGVTWEDVLDVR